MSSWSPTFGALWPIISAWASKRSYLKSLSATIWQRDSLDLVDLALALEERFGISVPEHILDQVRSYEDLVETTVDLTRSRRAAESRSAAQAAHFVARIVPAESRSGGILERGGWLTPYIGARRDCHLEPRAAAHA